MQRRNLGRLTLGTSVYIAEWMIGKHGPRHQGAHGYPTSHGIVKRVTPNGGVLVARAPVAAGSVKQGRSSAP